MFVQPLFPSFYFVQNSTSVLALVVKNFLRRGVVEQAQTAATLQQVVHHIDRFLN
jgi:hypothetical protein